MNKIQDYSEERYQRWLNQVRQLDFDLINRLSREYNDQMIAMGRSMMQLCALIRTRQRDSTKTSRDARFAARFGSPPRIEIRRVKLNPYEAREHDQSVADVFSDLAGSILKRPLTENERYGNALIPEAEKFVHQ
ncbi:MAG: hypothetical protein COV74_04970 [Candidatus Omnitrophica bacterium CG11_big_fil_rev_8_21_14_0_20_45_26]|uniref:Uncharacterized protein n=1 Tax=Candidatus Abzuiibacterium crystallinum TaxID=1974748 RepID=A0A2H0LRW7_9BACT|nr:MAG: hypothetical protein COV74_04970 [Candidatus Omnitrophica bacterium CG11_big_fil_rev_8_21_14_0_20_45_26]PIW63613.1 MAG: hypothetical protein COW12_09885 [Candidatus Omnitrophica bacterium CG12_big_fil_rev_8_21_14_0_65_45_16]